MTSFTSKTVLKPITVLSSNYLRNVGLPQSVHIGTGYTHTCGETKNIQTKQQPKQTKQPEESNRDNQIRPIYPGKVRLGFLPDEWFTYFYRKTGVTGPYVFGLGLLNFLFSKEIYVCDHEFYNGLALGILCIVGVKKFGPTVARYCDKEVDKVENNWKQMHESEIQDLQNLIDQEKQEQWRAEGGLLLMEVKKENIAMQLEAAYREGLMNVYRDVKQQLDYQVACRNVELRINHKHMVNWIVDQVEKALPKSDEETAKNRRANLSAMALRIKSS